MANGHVEIHDPLPSSTSQDPKPTSDTDSSRDTVEFRLLMAYATRRRTMKAEPATQNIPMAREGSTRANGSTSPQTPAETQEEATEGKRKKKKMGLNPLLSILRCIKPKMQGRTQHPRIQCKTGQRWDTGPSTFEEGKKEDKLEEVACRLTEIADEISFGPPEVEADSPGELECVIGLLLREAGDRLNEEELKNAFIATNVSWNYGFFERLMTALLTRMGLLSSAPDSPGPQASPKTQIAVTCEITSRLSAAATLPMCRMLDHGARYLQDRYSSWAQQQGGYEEAFNSDDEDDVQ